MADILKTLEERAKSHGEYENHAKIATVLKEVMRNNAVDWDNLPDHLKETLDMIQHKIARILNGGHNNIDNVHDIAGYSILSEQIIKKEALAKDKK